MRWIIATLVLLAVTFCLWLAIDLPLRPLGPSGALPEDHDRKSDEPAIGRLERRRADNDSLEVRSETEALLRISLKQSVGQPPGGPGIVRVSSADGKLLYTVRLVVGDVVERRLADGQRVLVALQENGTYPGLDRDLTLKRGYNDVEFDVSDWPVVVIDCSSVPAELRKKAVFWVSFVDGVRLSRIPSIYRVEPNSSGLVTVRSRPNRTICLSIQNGMAGKPVPLCDEQTKEPFFVTAEATRFIAQLPPSLCILGSRPYGASELVVYAPSAGMMASVAGLVVFLREAIAEEEVIVAGRQGWDRLRMCELRAGEVNWVEPRREWIVVNVAVEGDLQHAPDSIMLVGPEEVRTPLIPNAGDLRVRRKSTARVVSFGTLVPGLYSIRWALQGREESPVIKRVHIGDSGESYMVSAPSVKDRRVRMTGFDDILTFCREVAFRYGQQTIGSGVNDLALVDWGYGLPQEVAILSPRIENSVLPVRWYSDGETDVGSPGESIRFVSVAVRPEYGGTIEGGFHQEKTGVRDAASADEDGVIRLVAHGDEDARVEVWERFTSKGKTERVFRGILVAPSALKRAALSGLPGRRVLIVTSGTRRKADVALRMHGVWVTIATIVTGEAAEVWVPMGCDQLEVDGPGIQARRVEMADETETIQVDV